MSCNARFAYSRPRRAPLLAVCFRAGLCVALAGFAYGCGEEEPATEEPESTGPVAETEPESVPETEEAPEGEPAADSEASAVAEGDSFEIRLNTSGPYAPGTASTFNVALSPRGEWKINQLYPLSVQVTAPDGVALKEGNDVMNAGAGGGAGDAAEFGDTGARFDVEFTADAPGEHRVEAVVDFGVCIAERCMQERQTVAVVLPVEG